MAYISFLLMLYFQIYTVLVISNECEKSFKIGVARFLTFVRNDNFW